VPIKKVPIIDVNVNDVITRHKMWSNKKIQDWEYVTDLSFNTFSGRRFTWTTSKVVDNKQSENNLVEISCTLTIIGNTEQNAWAVEAIQYTDGNDGKSIYYKFCNNKEKALDAALNFMKSYKVII